MNNQSWEDLNGDNSRCECSVLMGLVLDTGHYTYGSGKNDPAVVLECLERFAERIWYMHFKDCHPGIADRAREEGWDYFEAIRQGVFCLMKDARP